MRLAAIPLPICPRPMKPTFMSLSFLLRSILAGYVAPTRPNKLRPGRPRGRNRETVEAIRNLALVPETASSMLLPAPQPGTCDNCWRSTAKPGAEDQNFRTRRLARLRQRAFRRNVDLF